MTLTFLLVASTLQATSISFSTYLGGSSADLGYGIDVDSQGNSFVTGWTQSTNFPTTSGSFNENFSGVRDIFVTKMNSQGSALVFSTYLGGSSAEEALAIKVDSQGNSYFSGSTKSQDFPTVSSSFDTTSNSSKKIFVTKLNNLGNSLIFSTFLGGTQNDDSYSLELSSQNEAIVSGTTVSVDFPVSSGAFDENFNSGFGDVLLTKFNPSGTALSFSTFLGGSAADNSYSLEITSDNKIIIAGSTGSSNFPTTNGIFQNSKNGLTDNFLTKFESDGTALNFSTFLGGSLAVVGGTAGFGTQAVYEIALNQSENAIGLTGVTLAVDFPTTSGSLSQMRMGSDDAFVTKMNSDGTALIFSTYFGDEFSETGYGIGFLSDESVVVTGVINFSAGSPSKQKSKISHGISDVFVSKLNALGNTMVFYDSLGGNDVEEQQIGTPSLVKNDFLFVTGNVTSVDFPTTNGAFSENYNSGTNDAFLTKYDFTNATEIETKQNLKNSFSLSQNYPNPFNPTTSINYELLITNYERSTLAIFNILGKKVKGFVLNKNKGSVVWNGTNELGEEVASGIYFYQLQNSGFSQTKKMLLLK
ncbi:MAG: T9SS C-terminal target domain-containing protein [Calditrichaeota bacterium]|nr:MAG: T9SS C-terminal target domain-containing protein [Calditrichota bacterium]